MRITEGMDAAVATIKLGSILKDQWTTRLFLLCFGSDLGLSNGFRDIEGLIKYVWVGFKLAINIGHFLLKSSVFQLIDIPPGTLTDALLSSSSLT